jgi:hypothetical protein
MDEGSQQAYHTIKLGNAHNEITCKFALFPLYGPLEGQIKLIFKMIVKIEAPNPPNRSTICIIVELLLLW